MSNSPIWFVDRTLLGANSPAQNGPGSDGNEGVFHIPRSSSITEALPSDSLMFYPSAGMQSMYSTALADFAKIKFGI